MATVAIVRYPGMKDKRGTVPLYVRVTAGSTVRYASLGLRLSERHWNAKAGEVRKTHPDHAHLNQYLLSVRAVAQSVVASFLAGGQKLTAARIRDGLRAELEGKSETREGDFLAYCEKLLREYERRGQVATGRGYAIAVRKLRDYIRAHHGWSELPFDELTVPLLRGYQTYLVEEVGNGTNTVHRRMRAIRALLYQAIRDGAFPQERNPFFHLTLRTSKVRKAKLSMEEIEAVEVLALKEETLLWHVRCWFLFAFYAGGMRFSDVATLRWESLRGDRLAYRMRKTDEVASVALVPPALELLAPYRHRDTGPEALVFPILDGYDTSTPASLLRAIGTRNALVNKYLKKIQAQAGLETKLSFHLARHSLADYLRRKGWGLYDISKVLGHANVQVTERYLKGFDAEDLDEKMRGLF